MGTPPRILSVAVTDRDRDDDQRDAPPEPWHNRTSTLLGASAAGLAAIALLIGAILYVTRQANEPQQPPNLLEPSYSTTRSGPTTSTTTATITSTSPPQTSDINPETTTPSSESSSVTTITTRPPRTRDRSSDSETTTTTSRNRPRTNVTRTLTPVP